MADVVSPAVRSRMMSGIRSTDTKPELLLRHGLHAMGFRYKLHDRSLAGRPDMKFTCWHAVLFAHGCFWHGHDCKLFRWPSTREEFWRTKIRRNQENDLRARRALLEAGWRHGVVWECALKGPKHLSPDTVIAKCAKWLMSDLSTFEVRAA